MEQPAKPLRDRERLRERLYKLDRSSIQFPEQLNELLQDDKWVEDLESLPEDELVELVDYLDNVRFISILTKPCSPTPQILDSLDHADLSFREGLHVLGKICSPREILPITCGVSDELRFDEQLVEYGRFGDIYKGTLGRADVCIRRIRAPSDLERAQVNQASSPHNLRLIIIS